MIRGCFVASCELTLDEVVRVFGEYEEMRYLTFLCLLAIIVVRHGFFFLAQRHFRMKVIATVQPWEFTLEIRVPGHKTEVQIKKELETVLAAHNVRATVMKVSKVYRLWEYSWLVRKVAREQLKLKRLELDGKSSSKTYDRSSKRLQINVRKLENIVSVLNSLEGEATLSAKTAFVTFRSNFERAAAQKVLHRHFFVSQSNTSGYYCVETKNPDGYIWASFGATVKYRVMVRGLILLGCVFITTLCFGLICGLKYMVKSVSSEFIAELPYVVINLVIYLIVKLANEGTSLIIVKLTKFGAHKQRELRLKTEVLKLFLAHFFNTSMVIFFASFIFKQGDWFQALWYRHGTAATITLELLCDIVYQPLTELFGPAFLHRHIHRWWIARRVQQDGSHNKVMQIELNHAFKEKRFELEKLYAHTLCLMATVLVFQVVIPYAAVLGLVGLVTQFLLQRWVLFKRSRRIDHFGFGLVTSVLAYLDLCLLMGTISLTVFYHVFVMENFWFNVSVCGAAVASLLWGQRQAHESLRIERQTHSKELLYENQWLHLTQDYDRTNPLSASRETKRWVKARTRYTDESGFKSGSPSRDANICKDPSELFEKISRKSSCSARFFLNLERGRLVSASTKRPYSNDILRKTDRAQSSLTFSPTNRSAKRNEKGLFSESNREDAFLSSCDVVSSFEDYEIKTILHQEFTASRQCLF